MDSSVCSQNSEPDGEFRDDYDNHGFVHIPQPPPAPNIVNEGAGPTIAPEGDTLVQAPAPDGAAVPPAPNIDRRTSSCACQHPLASWICGADGKLERVNLSELNSLSAKSALAEEKLVATYSIST